MQSTVMRRAIFKRRRFFRDTRGVSAVEFALIAPIMIALYFGLVETSNGYAAYRNVSLAASTVSNLTAQETTYVTGDVSNILNASTAIMTPYTTTGLKITVSCLKVASAKATVSWSATLNGSVRATGSTVTIPSALSSDGQLILSEVSYPYQPTIGFFITGAITLASSFYSSPRISAPTYNGISCS